MTTVPPIIQFFESIGELVELEERFNESIECECDHDDCLVTATWLCSSCLEPSRWCDNAHAFYESEIKGKGRCAGCEKYTTECWKITPLG